MYIYLWIINCFEYNNNKIIILYTNKLLSDIHAEELSINACVCIPYL